MCAECPFALLHTQSAWPVAIIVTTLPNASRWHLHLEDAACILIVVELLAAAALAVALGLAAAESLSWSSPQQAGGHHQQGSNEVTPEGQPQVGLFHVEQRQVVNVQQVDVLLQGVVAQGCTTVVMTWNVCFCTCSTWLVTQATRPENQMPACTVKLC